MSVPTRFDVRAIAGASCAGLLAVLVYLNALHNPFVYDDNQTVVANTSIQDLRDVRAIVLLVPTRPIVNASYAVDRALWGDTPFGFHLTNVLLHALNVLLLCRLTRRLVEDADRRRSRAGPIGADVAAFAAGALLAVHPLMTEAVGYISGRSEVLCATFFLLALLCGRRWVRGESAVWAVATIGCWVASLATKETAAIFPFLLVAYDRLAAPDEEPARPLRIRTVHAPLIAVTLTAGLVRLTILALVEYPGQTAFHWSFIPLALDVIRRYAGLLVVPTGQTVFHEVALVPWLGPRFIVGCGAVGLVIAVAWRLRRSLWITSFGLVWFLLALLPQSMLTLLDRGEPMAEHRVYLASCGAFVAVGAGIGWLGARLPHGRIRIAAAVGLCLVLLSFGAETLLRNAVWSDPIDLWQESVDLAPAHYRPRLLLGEALQLAGRRREAVDQYQIAIARRPKDLTGYAKLGLCLAEMGRLEESAASFKQLGQIEPGSPLASNGLGTVAMLSGQTSTARNYFRETIVRDPGNIPARQSLAILAELEANFVETLRLCREIQTLAPRTPGVDDCVRRNQLRLPTGSSPR